MLEILYLLIGSLIGSIASAVVAFRYTILNFRINEAHYQEADITFPYSIEEVWDYLSNTNYINCYKPHERPEHKDSWRTQRLKIKKEMTFVNFLGERIYVSECDDFSLLSYGRSPSQPEMTFRLYTISEEKTLVHLRRKVIPEELLEDKFISSLFNHFIHPLNLADFAEHALSVMCQEARCYFNYENANKSIQPTANASAD